MARLFQPASDTAFRLVLVGLLLFVGLLVVGPMLYVRTPYNQDREFPVDQPVQFDHRHHVGDDAIDCEYCHYGARKSAYAGIPPTEVCMGCHAQVWSRSAMLEPVRRSYFSGLPLAWNRVHDLPDFVYFDHSIHVQKGVGCVECHGRVDEMALDWQVASLAMGWCIGCHRDPAPHLRPAARVTSMTWKAPAGDAGQALARELGARLDKTSAQLTSCTTCHR